MVLVMLGALGSILCASRGTAMAPEGSAFFVGGAMKPEGPLGGSVAAGDARVFVNKFEIEYLPSGKVKQFTSDVRRALSPCPRGGCSSPSRPKP